MHLTDDLTSLLKQKRDQRRAGKSAMPEMVGRRVLLDLLDTQEEMWMNTHTLISEMQKRCTSHERWITDNWVGNKIRGIGLVRKQGKDFRRATVFGQEMSYQSET